MRLGNFHIKWQHDQVKGFTYVQVIGDDHPLPRSESFAAKSPKDNYNKAVGRKISLKRALEKTFEKEQVWYEVGTDIPMRTTYQTTPLFTKEERTAIWKDFREKFEKPDLPLSSTFRKILDKKDKEIEELKQQLKTINK